MASAGCTSIYHRTRSELPADPAAEVELRLQEARQAADQASQAARKLLGHLRQAKSGAVISTDFDRLEAAAYELERRTLAARDATARHDTAAEWIAELERLLGQAQAWLACVQAHRTSERAKQINQLETLLARQTEGATGTR